MKKPFKPQGKIKNKLVITWKDYSTKPFGTERESMRCTSEKSAQRILDKRTQNRMFFAKFYDETGKETLFNINSKETILAI